MILDVGCGHEQYHNKRGDVGIDLHKGLCDVQASAEKLPFRNEVFEATILHHVLEHISNVGLALSEIKRVLSVHGKVFAEVPNPHTFWIFKNILMNRRVAEDKTHVASFNEHQLTILFRRFGFKIGYLDYSEVEDNIRLPYHLIFRFFPSFRKEIRLTAQKGK